MLWDLIFVKCCTFWRLKFTKWAIYRAPKMEKMAFLKVQHSPKLISRKIWMIAKSCKQLKNVDTFLVIKENHNFSNTLGLICTVSELQPFLFDFFQTDHPVQEIWFHEKKKIVFNSDKWCYKLIGTISKLIKRSFW